MPSYQQGRLAEALRDVYLHIDELLSSEALREELNALAGPKEPSGGQRHVHAGQPVSASMSSKHAQCPGCHQYTCSWS